MLLVAPARSTRDICPCTWALPSFCLLKGAASWPQAPGAGSVGPSDANGEPASSSQAAVAGDFANGCACWHARAELTSPSCHGCEEAPGSATS